jgi:hypothetical protein
MMTRLLLVLVALCGLAAADNAASSAAWPLGFPTTAANNINDCFLETAIEVPALQYATVADTPLNSGTTTAGKAERSCAAMAAAGATPPDWFSAIYSDRVWAVDRAGNGHCLNVGSYGKSLSGSTTIPATVGQAFRPANSDQTYQLLVTGELFGCQFDSNPDNTATDKTNAAKPVTAWRGERFNVFRTDGYNMNTFTSATGVVAVGFFDTTGVQLTWDNPTNDGMNTQWAAPFAGTCGATASTLICSPGETAPCTGNQQRAQIACATSAALLAYSGKSFTTYPCGITDRDGITSASTICTGRTKPDFSLGNQIFTSGGIFTWIQTKMQPKITAFQNQTISGWGFDASRKFYVTDNQQITVDLSGTSNSALQGRLVASATNNLIFNNKVFIDKTIGVSTAAPAVSLNQIDYNSNTNRATFRAADGKCQTPATGNGATTCGDQTNGFVIGQQYWAKVQSTYSYNFSPFCESLTGVANYPYIFNCGGDYTTATTNGMVYNNAANNYPTSQRQYAAQAMSAGKQNIHLQALPSVTVTSDPVYLGFLSYGANEEFDVAQNWVAETRNLNIMGTEDRTDVSVAKPVYMTEFLKSEAQYEDHKSAQLIANQTNTQTAKTRQAEEAFLTQQLAVEQKAVDNAKAAADAADKRAETFNYAMGLVGAGIVVFAVFFLFAVCIFSAAYVKANQGTNRDLTSGDLTFSKTTEMSRT